MLHGVNLYTPSITVTEAQFARLNSIGWSEIIRGLPKLPERRPRQIVGVEEKRGEKRKHSEGCCLV